MFVSFIVHLVAISGLISFSCATFFNLSQGNTGAAKLYGFFFLLLFIFLSIYRGRRKKLKSIKVAKWVNKACADAQSALNRKSFHCPQCHRWHAICDAELIAIAHDSEEDYDERTGDYKTRKTHTFDGLVCRKCAKITRHCSNDETSYISIPKELRP